MGSTLLHSPSSKSALKSAPASIPWYLWCAAAAVTSVAIGAHWDVSWHRSIGRDTFWTPAHIAIYMCGVLAAVCCSYLILNTTFRHPAKLTAASVQIFGFRAPLGAFIASWGGIAMLTAAPFDNWWHNAYGLDVKIVSPPHSLLMLGIFAIAVGTLILIQGAMNRAPDARAAAHLQWLMLYVGGLMMVLSMFFRMEYTWDISLHGARSYQAMAIGLPTLLAMVWYASGNRFAGTWISGIYTAFLIGIILILPLFPAEPKLGPVYHQVTQFIPPKFPILIVVPALALDLLWSRTRSWKPWLTALTSGPVFVLTLVAAEWPFADFLMSKHSANRFFATNFYDYGTPPTSLDATRRFWNPEHGTQLWTGLLWAMLFAALSTWAGIAVGKWMRRVQR